jgi:hypothetical protein
MNYRERIGSFRNDAQGLEELYQQAVRKGEGLFFAQALDEWYAVEPQELIWQVWHHRLVQEAKHLREPLLNWKWLLPISLVVALLAGIFSNDMVTQNVSLRGRQPWLFLIAPLVGFGLMIYFGVSERSKLGIRRAGLCAGALMLVSGLGTWFVYQTGWFRWLSERQNYETLLMVNLALLSWAAVGFLMVKAESRSVFAFLRKSLEVFVAGGVFSIVAVLFLVLTFGLFQALSVNLPYWLTQGLMGASVAVAVLLAAAGNYDPSRRAEEQVSERGLGRLVVSLMRILLPLSIVVLVIYLGFMLFNFRKPFEDRDVLIVYNLLLFAVIGQILGLTPLDESEVLPSWRGVLRVGVMVLVGLVLIVCGHAMAAVIYRTLQGGYTINRVTILGWNVINLFLLGLMEVRLIRGSAVGWGSSVQRTLALIGILYPAWALLIVLAGPLMF